MKISTSDVFALSLIFILFFLKLLPHKDVFAQTFDFTKAEEVYYKSHYSPQIENRQLFMDDHLLYPFAGISYLTQGTLDSINVEHPPLVKYLFALTYFVFGNPTLLQPFLGLILLFCLYFISKKALSSSLLAFIPPIALVFEELFLIQSTHSLLDLFQTTAILLFILFAILLKPSLKKQIILGVILGVVAGSKFPTAAFILFGSYFGYRLVWEKKETIKDVCVTGLAALLIYSSLYIPLLLSTGIQGVVSVHLQALKIHLSHLPHYPPLVPLKVMFLNQWPVWFDEQNPIHHLIEWNILWPLAALALLLSPLVFWKTAKKSKEVTLILLFSLLYFVFINTRLFFPHYLFPILGFCYLILIWEVQFSIKWLKKLHIFRALSRK